MYCLHRNDTQARLTCPNSYTSTPGRRRVQLQPSHFWVAVINISEKIPPTFSLPVPKEASQRFIKNSVSRRPEI